MSEKNVVYEWAKKIKKAADNGLNVNDKTSKNDYFNRIVGLCEGILCTMDCVDEEKYCKDCDFFHVIYHSDFYGETIEECECQYGDPVLSPDNEACDKFQQKPLLQTVKY